MGTPSLTNSRQVSLTRVDEQRDTTDETTKSLVRSYVIDDETF